MAIIKTLSIEAEGLVNQLTGGEFYDMLEAVKSIQGRRWDGDREVWILPISLEEASRILAEDGYTIVGNEDELIDEEINQIQATINLLAQNQDLLESKICALREQVAKYSYNSKSRVKANLARDEACLRGALKSLSKNIEALAEVEIRSMRRACKILEIE